MASRIYGYAGKLLRVDLSQGTAAAEELNEDTLKKCIGGTGLGVKVLYEEVPPELNWADPRNRLVLASGPLGGTTIKGSGTYSVVTKGAQTNGATSTQANGFFGAYLRTAGFDGIVIQGKAKSLAYLYIHDGTAELRDAEHLRGKDTWETEEAIKKELGLTEKGSSVIGIGPAGENLVRFAAIAGDKGHVAGHNGPGAVMGAKNLKAIAVARGRGGFQVKDRAALKAVGDELFENTKNTPGLNIYQWGTSMGFVNGEKAGTLPVKNYTTNIYPETAPFMGENYRKRYQIKPNPCWACQMHHCHIMKIPDGPYAGFVGEEPEYEQWANWGPVIGNTNVDAAFVLANDVDRLGMETNEAGWVVGFAMECFQKGIITGKDTGGLELTWGNAEAARTLLRQIAHRRGLGEILAEGTMRASQRLGGEARNMAVFTRKGNAPRGHDHRTRWFEMFDTCVSNTSTIETTSILLRPEDLGLPAQVGQFDSDGIATFVAKSKGSMQFEDSLGVCRFTVRTDVDRLAKALNAATGWDFTLQDAMDMGRRTVNMMRVYNLRCGITKEMDAPSPRYSSIPSDGPSQGRNVAPHWEGMLRLYYRLMGWDEATGKPLPETLKALGLDNIVADVWGKQQANR
ncbi:MAG: hypothetical protein HY676_00250 [Chloroflexi bacterium]|nr:hypothetical protein [Chloroflexota bacterium]